MKKLLKNYLIKLEDNKLSLDEIEALRFAEEGSVEKKVFWELQEIARQKKDADDFFEQMKYQKKLL
jgi:predicted DNA-binding protein (UPF0251 family)